MYKSRLSKKGVQIDAPTISAINKGVTTFGAILYRDTDSYDINDVLCKLKSMCDEKGYSYWYIFHDKDIFEKNTYDKDKHLIGNKGELKKPHYHIIVDMGGRYQTINDLSINLGIPQHFIQKVKYLDGSLIYLNHEYEI